VIAADYPGTGRNIFNIDLNMTFEKLSCLYWEILDKLHIEKTCLIGLSFGKPRKCSLSLSPFTDSTSRYFAYRLSKVHSPI
jgi:hypothetical protein